MGFADLLGRAVEWYLATGERRREKVADYLDTVASKAHELVHIWEEVLTQYDS